MQAAAAAGVEGEEAGVPVRGGWGTKLEAVVRRLLWLTSSDPTARILVFSQWKDALSLLAQALTANGLPYVYPRSGGKKFEEAVAWFRSGHAEAVAAEQAAAGAATATEAAATE